MKKKEKKRIIRKIIYLLIVLLTIAILYSTSIKTLNIKEYAIINNKININHHGLKIVHFSDMHYGTTIKLNDLKKIVSEINLLNPDIIVFTGDLIDKHYIMKNNEINDFLKEFNKVKANIAYYLIKGNHDYSETFNKLIDNTSFKVLKNELITFYYQDNTPINIIGLESKLKNKIDISKAFANYNKDYYTILLIHEPDVILDIEQKVDLVLAGHSHNGQIRIPFIGTIYTPEGAKTYYDEKYKIDNTDIYISSGLGTSKYPIRLFNSPSFNFYRLYNN
ncbi:MAG: metallophosphoesterase [Bacilli bacterium]|nr:metallophosphoesterase [Bacilli bacterium]MDD4406436.1 metallophosphoesterase [Bacilli bacterium]